ncbi:zinc phosphodiesterase ELAC protein 2 [Dorcoceras hygrometricum]|uniref:ribonuclease Z n=1 Tax=Dorcoceras hygrometricum TaxID=472368 RepID=A0A2Z7B446_9LAMI|nr:zinc phosphodiesterase ELAC protein 2 [Dorcoceras hygrometricum]
MVTGLISIGPILLGWASQLPILKHRFLNPANPSIATMPQVTSFRLLFSSANHHHRHPFSAAPRFFSQDLFLSSLPSLSKTIVKKHNSISYFTTFSSYNKKPDGKINKNCRSLNRKQSSLRGTIKNKDIDSNKGGLLAMEEKLDNTKSVDEGFGFNRKRAEGRDEGNRNKNNLQLKVRKLNPVNTISYVQILGTGMDTQDTSPSVLLFFDKQRFIFNAGEGLQRYCTEHKIKLSKIDHIFLSRVCSETAGGLPGLLLTLAGIGDEGMTVNVWGPSDLKYLLDAMKSFIPNAAMVYARSFGPTPNPNMFPRQISQKFGDPLVLIDDEVIKISAIILRPMEGRSHVLSSPQSGLNDTKPGDLSVIYICELPEIKGKFDPKKASCLGLKPGPKYRELQLGNSVKSDRQNIMVHPSDVMGPSVPGPIVLLVDCPTLAHFEELSALQCLMPYYADIAHVSPECSKIVNCVIHLSPAFLSRTADYQMWMSKFGAAQHIMAGHEMRNVEVPIMKSSARIATRLNYLCPQFFPAPGFWSLQHLKSLPSDANLPNNALVSKTSEIIPAENLLKFNLRPYANLGLDKSGISNLSSPSEIIDELKSEIPEIVNASKQVSQFWWENRTTSLEKTSLEADIVMTEEPWLPEGAIPSCLENITREELEIVLLGTGSSQPSKYRNVSSIFINLFSKGSLLLDCGEGTLGQLKRRFGIEGADEAVKGLRCIWISHIHADHHVGLARILALRRDLLKGSPKEPVIVVGPRQLKRFLDAYQRLEDLDMQFLDCGNTTEASLEALELNDENVKSLDPNGKVDKHVDSTLFARGSRMQSYWKGPGSHTQNVAAIPVLKSLKKVLNEAGLEALISFPVIHCPQAFGVVLKGANRVNRVGKTVPGWKIVYSGDTRPCPELVKASSGATATFEDSMVDEAIARNHSTTKEAVEVGDSAGAYRIILTHFSQRYPKIPVFNEDHMHKTCIAFDLMSVNLADLHVLPRVLPFLKLLFRDEIIVDESDDVNLINAIG